MRKLILCTILIFLLSNLAYAIIVETGTVFDDDLTQMCVGQGYILNSPNRHNDGWVYYDGSAGTPNYAKYYQADPDEGDINNPYDLSGDTEPIPEFSKIGIVLVLFVALVIVLVIRKRK